LHRLDGDNGSTLSIEELASVRRELAESKSLLEQHSKTIDDLSNEKSSLEAKKTDLEIRLNTLEVEYEELLDKTIAEEETAEDRTVDIAETVSNLKVLGNNLCNTHYLLGVYSCYSITQVKLESQYASKKELQEKEVEQLKQEVERKNNDFEKLSSAMADLKAANDELQVSAE
jgi:kinesin family protein 5